MEAWEWRPGNGGLGMRLAVVAVAYLLQHLPESLQGHVHLDGRLWVEEGDLVAVAV